MKTPVYFGILIAMIIATAGALSLVSDEPLAVQSHLPNLHDEELHATSQLPNHHPHHGAQIMAQTS